MKKLATYIILIISVNLAIAQTSTLDVYDSSYFDYQTGTYFKDINNTFDKYLGTWKWKNGNEILIFKIEKVTQFLNLEYGVYEDFIKGNYSYSIDGGQSFVINTISQNLGISDPKINAMYSCGTLDLNKITYTFKDVIKDKTRCIAIFTFLPNSLNQLTVKLENVGGSYFLPNLQQDPYFSIPNNVIFTKQ